MWGVRGQVFDWFKLTATETEQKLTEYGGAGACEVDKHASTAFFAKNHGVGVWARATGPTQLPVQKIVASWLGGRLPNNEAMVS